MVRSVLVAPFVLAALPCVAVSACQSEPTGPLPAPTTGANTSASAQTSAAPAGSTPQASRPAAPRPIPPKYYDIGRASNAFGFDVHQKIRGTPGNVALSPASLSLALTMTWAGARSTTAAQMAKALHIDRAAEAAWATMAGETSAYLASGGCGENDRGSSGQPGSFQMKVANRIFAEKSFSFEASFLELTRSSFEAPVELTDFRTAFEPARQHINDWVSNATDKRISTILPPGSLSIDTTLVLVNALAFVARWQTKFDVTQTKPGPFHPSKTRSWG